MERQIRRGKLLDDLSKTWAVQRLKQIDLSAVPKWLCPGLSSASRYQHSLSVGRLSLLVSDGTEHDRLLLTGAAVLHDVGNGPFPHISDPLMKEMLGFSHEGAVRFAFENSPAKDSSMLDSYRLDLAEVSSVLERQHRLSRFLYGFPDLDNADNVHRFISTIPGKPLGEPSYRPSEICAWMSLEAENETIPENLRRRWLRDYEKVYSYVWNDRLNMICWTMLGRALRILKNDLTPSFFRMTNREAFHLIRLRLPELATRLKRKEFKILLDRKYRNLRGEARKLSNPEDLREAEDEMCKEARLEGWSMGLTVDQPVTREKPDHWRVYLVSHKGGEKLAALLEEKLSGSESFC